MMCERLWLMGAWSLVLCLVCGGAAGAQTRLERTLEETKKNAARLAASGQLDAALKAIGQARAEVREESRWERGKSMQRLAMDPRKKKELRELQSWFEAQNKLAHEGKVDLETVTRQHTLRRAAIEQKYKTPEALRMNAERQNSDEAQARYDLLTASLDELAARYLAQKGTADRAGYYRKTATTSRMWAYRTLKRNEDASEAAALLVRTVPSDPDAHAEAARFYQEGRDFNRAVPAWEQAIRLLESGKGRVAGAGSAAPMKGALTAKKVNCYRQVAYCYQQMGRKSDAEAAMKKAAELETAERATKR